jgi:hypothetical protein
MNNIEKLKLIRRALTVEGGLEALRAVLRSMSKSLELGSDPLHFEIAPGLNARSLLEMLEDPFREEEVRRLLEKVSLILSTTEFRE